MSTTNKKDKAEEYKIAEQDWNREIEILKLLARKRQISVIASQFSENDRQIRRIRDKAMDYSANLIVTLPLEIQDYLIEQNKKHGLRARLRQEVEELREKSRQASLGVAIPTARERLDAYRMNLCKVAKKLSIELRLIRQNTLTSYATIAEIGVGTNNFKLLKLLEDPHIKNLLLHMQAELPHLRRLMSWDDLLVKEITEGLLDRLSLRAERGDFQGKCEVC